MYSNEHSAYSNEVYFTPKDNITKALQQNNLHSRKLEKDPELFDPTATDISSASYKEYYEYNDIKEEYVLPPNNQKKVQSESDVTARPTKKRDVRDLYDDEHYSLPDISGCITKEMGRPKNALGEKKPQSSSEEGKSKLSANKIKIIVFTILLLAVGGIAGICLFVFTVITSFSFDV